MRNVPGLETVERDFSPQGVKFYYIYKALAHPETNGYITPFTLEERLMHIAEAKRKLGSRITWLCDTMSNDLKHALGNAPNSEFIIAPDGQIVRARQWSNPQALRQDLTSLVGRVRNPTTLADLDMKRPEPPKTAATGVVARVTLPGRMMPVQVRPAANLAASAVGEEPFYVKLRAEVDSQYFSTGSGKLYLGFFLDPLYRVHWNNQAAPVVYEIQAPNGLQITPSAGKAPEVKLAADADPREFLVDVSGAAREPIRLTVKYFACDDAETFCKPVTQHYEVTLERDPDGGSRRGGGRFFAGGRGRGSLRRSGFGPPGFGPRAAPTRSSESDPKSQRRSRILTEAVRLFREHDQNKDGKLARQELGRRNQRFATADANSDDLITLQEMIDWMKNRPR